MAQKTYSMVARRDLDGLEGPKKKGDTFEVKPKDRADALHKAGLADFAEEKKSETKAAK